MTRTNSRVLAVGRASVFSPNHIGNDAAILRAVAERLRKRGMRVELLSEEAFAALEPGDAGVGAVVAMCRSAEALARLALWQQAGVPAVNTARGIANCVRERYVPVFAAAGIPVPPSVLVDTARACGDDIRKVAGDNPAWVKRADSHACHKEDICYVRHPREAADVLSEFALRGIRSASVSPHIQGDLIKFYGVQGSRFFRWIYPFESHINGEHEAVNGSPRKWPFDARRLEEICRQAASLVGVDIFGGDCIVTPEGSPVIIDFKDWPSFAPCREEAAVAIARTVAEKVQLSDR